ncbi:hypothetical protein F503_00034 [Ophiostoma piceae UAMH 11346]|uniref:Uncharacterized protein n=1 Tax=Ophiostoma piceae (strain UAMH 11346) TaxID=1262450 RepID=S3CVS3_OPHP1|nr:hypothetical protein F503_00034 [Ophiostoma piceae UAMH 11346]
MGQVCCVPRKRQSRRTAKVKAEARDASSPGRGAQIPQASPSMTDTHADLLHSGRIDELREMHAVNNSPVRGIREPREWLQQKKHRLAGHRRGKKAQLPETFTAAQDKHKHKQKYKVRVARNEASFADNNEPITLLEATLLEAIPLDEAEGLGQGQSVQAATPPNGVRTMHLQKLLHESPEMMERQINPQPNTESWPSGELLSPIPRRPANALQIPFINETSDASTCSSKRNSKEINAEMDTAGEPELVSTTAADQGRDSTSSSEKNSTASTETVIARRIHIDHDDDGTDASTVRYSISSMSPDIFYTAPTSPRYQPASHVLTPALILTPASPPALSLQPQHTHSAISNSDLLDVKLPVWFPQSRWVLTASSSSILPITSKQPSNDLEETPTSDRPPFVLENRHDSEPSS